MIYFFIWLVFVVLILVFNYNAHRKFKIALILVLLSVTSIAGDKDSTGYLVVQNINFEFKVLKTASIDSVQAISVLYGIDAKEVLKSNNYFEFKNDWDYLYVERKRIVVKKGKVVYRKIKGER